MGQVFPAHPLIYIKRPDFLDRLSEFGYCNRVKLSNFQEEFSGM